MTNCVTHVTYQCVTCVTLLHLKLCNIWHCTAKVTNIEFVIYDRFSHICHNSNCPLQHMTFSVISVIKVTCDIACKTYILVTNSVTIVNSNCPLLHNHDQISVTWCHFLANQWQISVTKGIIWHYCFVCESTAFWKNFRYAILSPVS